MSRLAVDKIIGANTESIIDLSSISNIKMPAGHVIQYKFQTSSTKITVTTSSFTATGVSISFTPKFATSLIQVFWDGHISKSTSAAGGFGWQLYKDSTALHDVGQDSGNRPWSWYKDETRITGREVRTHTHLAENTNARTYTCKFKSYDSGHQMICNNDSTDGGEEEIMTVMEIAQ